MGVMGGMRRMGFLLSPKIHTFRFFFELPFGPSGDPCEIIIAVESVFGAFKAIQFDDRCIGMRARQRRKPNQKGGSWVLGLGDS
jgi:hypothetical protein